MILKTRDHGEINYEEKDIITFKKGIPGLHDLRNFIIFEIKENPVFKILHSIEDMNIGFIVISPFDFFKEYELVIEDKVLKELEIEKEEEVMVLNTVTLNSNVKNITTNLKAPIIINIKSLLGEQIIIDKEKYKVKHPLIKE
ncbi:flagellar assembly protein FliW [Clostridium hydrogeniformans]|uniref:flagellar assembly protein FliW n=1 Tax=Clostridium hydrogeniformans TaxID=349933 RepID=UPI00048644D2|nr:flagellar assembly protein FliW [Clostridium hydrogeniformans]